MTNPLNARYIHVFLMNIYSISIACSSKYFTRCIFLTTTNRGSELKNSPELKRSPAVGSRL